MTKGDLVQIVISVAIASAIIVSVLGVSYIMEQRQQLSSCRRDILALEGQTIYGALEGK